VTGLPGAVAADTLMLCTFIVIAPGLPGAPVNNARSPGVFSALLSAVMLIPVCMRPDVPPKSIVPSKAARLSMNIVVGVTLTKTVLSGRCTDTSTAGIMWTWSGISCSDSTEHEPVIVLVTEIVIEFNVPRLGSNRSKSTVWFQVGVVDGMFEVTHEWFARAGTASRHRTRAYWVRMRSPEMDVTSSGSAGRTLLLPTR